TRSYGDWSSDVCSSDLVLYERAAWQFKERYARAPDEEYVDAMRDGVRLASARGVTAVHDKDGWLGAIGLWQRLEQQGGLPLRVRSEERRVGKERRAGGA